MRSFPGYPIVINYNVHTVLRERHNSADLHRAGQYEAVRQTWIKTTTTSDSSIENNMWKQEIDQYENTVYRCLQKITANPVGRMVVGKINKQTRVWIIPKSDADLNVPGGYNAQTGPLNYDIQWDGNVGQGSGSGDTVISYNPKLGDDVLFHELVHAYRYSYKNKFNPRLIIQNHAPKTRANTEEFFAHQMENIYLSQDHRTLTMAYEYPLKSTKEEIYDFLANNTDMLMALKSFLRHEYLAILAAHGLDTQYNPFRDYKTLEAKWLEGSPSMHELPELDTMRGPMKQTPRNGRRMLASFIPADGGSRRKPGPIGMS